MCDVFFEVNLNNASPWMRLLRSMDRSHDDETRVLLSQIHEKKVSDVNTHTPDNKRTSAHVEITQIFASSSAHESVTTRKYCQKVRLYFGVVADTFEIGVHLCKSLDLFLTISSTLRWVQC